MKVDQVFGLLVILLAIYLGLSASTRESVDLGPPASDADVPIVSGRIPDSVGGPQTDDGGDAAADNAAEPTGNGDEAQRATGVSVGNEYVIIRSDFCAAAPQQSRYSDLGSTNDAAIRCMEAIGVVTGTSGSRFDPADAVTRDQAAAAIAAMIDRANDLEAEGVDLRDLPLPDDARFRDITPDTPHRLAIARLNETPILQGYVDARYEPGGKVTRAQMASLLDRSYQYMTRAALPAGPDRFHDDEDSVHEESINAVAAANIMHGVGDGRFAPRRSVKRGEMARYLALIMVRMEEKNLIVPLPEAPTK